MKRSDEHNAALDDRPMFHIGAVAELTGLKPETIRVWERRYGVVTPQRSDGGTRRFSESDIVRLRLLRALCDQDHSIGTIAHLDNDALRQKLSAVVEPTVHRAPSAETAGVSVAVLHGTLRERIDGDSAPHTTFDLHVAHEAPTLEAFLSMPAERPSEIVVAALPLLGDDPVAALRRCVQHVGAQSVLVIYHFAPQAVLTSLVRFGARLVQGPVRTTALAQALIDQVTIHRLQTQSLLPGEALTGGGSTPPPRRFLDHELDALRDVHSSIECDCPNHLSQLASALVAFEDFSRRCEHTNPEDEDLHAYLANGGAQARAIIERLLEHAIEHAGIEPPR
jgi:MerR family transcriptional regulator, light-induced transcriptional regulator